MAGGCRVYVISLLRGSEQKLGEFAVSEADPARYSSIAWSPDANYVAASGTPLPQSGHPRRSRDLSASGDSRRPTAPRPGREEHGALQSGIFARRPSSGLRFVQRTAVVRCLRHRSRRESGSNDSAAATHAGDLSAHRKGRMESGRRFDHLRRGGGSASNHLWRIAADGASPPERLEAAGFARLPATASVGNRAAFTHWRFDVDINRFDRDGPGQALLTSTFLDMNPRFSPDGLRIAFSSGRTAETPEIWVAAADGRGAHQLTHGPGIWQTCPDWSPDGRHIVFESVHDDLHRLWTIEAEGGAPRQLTTTLWTSVAQRGHGTGDGSTSPRTTAAGGVCGECPRLEGQALA